MEATVQFIRVIPEMLKLSLLVLYLFKNEDMKVLWTVLHLLGI